MTETNIFLSSRNLPCHAYGVSADHGSDIVYAYHVQEGLHSMPHGGGQHDAVAGAVAGVLTDAVFYGSLRVYCLPALCLFCVAT